MDYKFSAPEGPRSQLPRTPVITHAQPATPNFRDSFDDNDVKLVIAPRQMGLKFNDDIEIPDRHATPAKSTEGVVNEDVASEAPPTGPHAQKLVLSLKPAGAAATKASGPTRDLVWTANDTEKGGTDSFTTEPPTTSRRGRREAARKKKQYVDAVYGEEYDVAVSAQLAERVTRKTKDNAYMSRSPTIPILRKAGRRHKRPSFELPETVYEHEDFTLPTSDTWSQTLSPRAVEDPSNLIPQSQPVVIDRDVYRLFDLLSATDGIPTELPCVYPPGSDREEPWTARQLTHLYIICYEHGETDLCDLIADCWIRAFQRVNRVGTETKRIWRRNKNPRKDPNAKELPQACFENRNPQLAACCTSFNTKLINDLFTATPSYCPIRMLWADAMALCGFRIEDQFEKEAKGGANWHPDVCFDIMCSALRQVGRKLTFKVEEYTEGVWCERYHLHSLKGQACYWEVAGQKMESESLKRGVDEVDGTEEPPPKRVMFE